MGDLNQLGKKIPEARTATAFASTNPEKFGYVRS
jgi:hypothetical protein